MPSPVIVWFRRDLRLHDNDALAFAVAEGGPVVPVFLWCPEDEGFWAPGEASRWWLHHALGDLDRQLRDLGGQLVIRSDSRKGGTLRQLCSLAKATGAGSVVWNRIYEPGAIERDSEIKKSLRGKGLRVKSLNSSLLFEPGKVLNKSGSPFQVFTPFWKHCSSRFVPAPAHWEPKACQPVATLPKGETVESLGLLGLLPRVSRDTGFSGFWGEPTRAATLRRLGRFVRDRADAYPEARDLPGLDGTSRLSAALHFGQVGPREVWKTFSSASNRTAAFDSGILRQLVWREFAGHLLFNFPETPMKPLRPEYALFPWCADERLLKAWQNGETGFPVVDAGMRQLLESGWMHNRVRMVVGSLLVKHLLQHWIEGARWFWDTLVDADLANNTLDWQWIAGCGADAAPYFRIFNPIAQGERFDPQGDYVRKYVPELGKLPASHIHKPWELGELELADCGVVLGRDYPKPVVGHAEGRSRALAAFAKFNELKR